MSVERFAEMKPTLVLNGRSLMVIVLVLSVIGLIMIYSASGVLAQKYHHDSAYFLKKQLVWMGLGISLFFIATRIDYHQVQNVVFPIAALVFVLLVSVLLFGAEINGSQRWLRLGPISFQPSEVAKLFTVIYLAHYVVKKGEKMRDFLEGLAPALVLIALQVMLIVVEPDLGASATILFLAVILLFLGGASLKHLFLIGTGVVPLLAYWVIKTPYRKERLLAYLNPSADPSASGFQMTQSYLALGSGGVVGMGLGEGRQKLFFLPEPHTDFIFSVIGEEFGMLGTLSLLLLFLLLLWGGWQIALMTEDPFGRMLAIGTTVMIALPALLNMGVVTGLLPTKGLPLPFVSYGGSSLLINWVAVGLLFNVSRGCKKRCFG